MSSRQVNQCACAVLSSTSPRTRSRPLLLRFPHEADYSLNGPARQETPGTYSLHGRSRLHVTQHGCCVPRYITQYEPEALESMKASAPARLGRHRSFNNQLEMASVVACYSLRVWSWSSRSCILGALDQVLGKRTESTGSRIPLWVDIESYANDLTTRHGNPQCLLRRSVLWWAVQHVLTSELLLED